MEKGLVILRICAIMEGFPGDSAVRSCLARRRTLLHIMWQPEWEGSLGENGYMCICGWVPSPFSWNWHSIANWLCACAQLLSCVWLLATPWTIAPQAPLSVGFSRQEYWSGLPCPPPGVFPTQKSNPGFPHGRWNLYYMSHQGSPRILEWVAYPFSRGSSQLRNQTGVSCIAGGFFTNWAIWEAPNWLYPNTKLKKKK